MAEDLSMRDISNAIIDIELKLNELVEAYNDQTKVDTK